MAASSAVTSIRCSESAGIQRIASVPSPKRSAAVGIHVWVSADV
jgi:hypothetical protein